MMTAGFAMIPMAIQPLVSGKFYLDAGKALKAVVDTLGNDVEHMMDGLAKLRNAVRLEAIVAIVAVVLGILLAFVVAAAILAGVR